MVKPKELYSLLFSLFGIQKDRSVRLLVELRKKNLFTDGRNLNNNVTAIDAAHLFRLLAINPNPFNYECGIIIDSHVDLISRDKRLFIEDCAYVILNDLKATIGFSKNQSKTYISLDNEFIHYGTNHKLPIENWVIIEPTIINQISKLFKN